MIFILLPAYNEEKNLKKVFKKIEKINNKTIKITVILVDDCSTDKTKLLTNKKYKFKLHYIKHKKNKGLSLTMETGLNFIKRKAKNGDIIISLDSDNTHPISLITKMIKKIKKNYDIVIASRFVNGSRVNGLVFWRHMMSLGAKYLFKIIYPYKNLNDYTCNFRAYKFETLKPIFKNKNFFKNEDFNIAAKILLALTRNNKKIKLAELPFTLRYDYKIGQSKMKIFKTILLTLNLIFFKKHT